MTQTDIQALDTITLCETLAKIFQFPSEAFDSSSYPYLAVANENRNIIEVLSGKQFLEIKAPAHALTLEFNTEASGQRLHSHELKATDSKEQQLADLQILFDRLGRITGHTAQDFVDEHFAETGHSLEDFLIAHYKYFEDILNYQPAPLKISSNKLIDILDILSLPSIFTAKNS
jgi:hypothetical protein